MAALQEYLRPDEVIVTDMGTAHICANQVLKLAPPQRLISSGGLGEMGCGLPLAIGASYARDRGEVLCMVGDGGMMMNLQELQTIIQHQLRIKIIVFSNDGYLMIKHTQRVAGDEYAGVNAATGVSCPSFRALAQTMGMAACDVRTWDDFSRAIPQLFYARGPALVEFHMHPEQPLVPRLDPIYVDGKPVSPRFCDMSPRIEEDAKCT
jgi:acetolactate synthase-1/2/3 large subunit